MLSIGFAILQTATLRCMYCMGFHTARNICHFASGIYTGRPGIKYSIVDSVLRACIVWSLEISLTGDSARGALGGLRKDGSRRQRGPQNLSRYRAFTIR